jgi:DNA-binding SARP family transcriptional activator
MNSELRYRLLGPIEVIAGRQVVAIERPRHRAVLAYLLLHTNRLVPTDRIVEALWGGAAPATARTQVQTDLSLIRRVLRATGGTDPIATRATGYLLEAADGQLDTDQFTAAVTEARALASSARARAVNAFRRALDLWRGPALADVTGAYVDAFRTALDEKRLHAYHQVLTLELEMGRHAAVIAELTTLVDAHPLDEGFAGQLILALYRSGRQAEALQVARVLRRTLADHHGLDPGHPVQDLEQAIRRNDPALDLRHQAEVLISSSSSPPLTAPVPIPAVAPMAAAPDPAHPTPAQLPADIADFVGRADDWRQLDLLIPRAGAMMPTTAIISAVVGAAGIGKTALAVHWGHSVVDHFPDGQLYIDMRGYSSDPPLQPLEALSRFLRALGLRPERIPADLDEASATYRSMLAKRRLLVIVDNANHVNQVRPLLPATSGCLCVVTSRSQLAGLVAMNAARSVSLDLLPLGDAVALLGRVLGEARVAAEPAAIAELARACGYLPLALRIAAAQLLLDPRRRAADLVAQLTPGDRVSTLHLPDDQSASVQAAFDSSYQSLTPELRRAFRLLGVVTSLDISVPGAAVLVDLPEARTSALLARLTAAHLVSRVGDRYAMHDLVREYAGGLSLVEDSPADRAAAVARLHTWYLRTSDAATALVSTLPVRLELPAALAGPGQPLSDHTAALAWLNSERANLIATIRHAAQTTEPALAWLLADLLRGYLRRGMHVNEWIDAARIALGAAGKARPPERARVESISHLSLGLAYQASGKPAEAAAEFSLARDVAEQVGWLDLVASATGNLGVMAWRAGDLVEAAALLEHAVDLARQAGAVGIEANNLGNLAIVSRTLGRPEEAARGLRELIPLFQRTGNREGEAHARSNLAELLGMVGRWDEVIETGTRAAELFRAIGDASEVASLAMVGLAHCQLGRCERGAEFGQAGLEIARRAGQPYLELDCLELLTDAHVRQGDHRAALEYAEAAVRVAAEVNSPEATIRAELALAQVHRAAHRHGPANDIARAAVARGREAGIPMGLATALVVLAEVARDCDDRVAAAEHATEALGLSREMGLVPLIERADQVILSV